MRTSCLVNNYNYRRFVGEAVDSALAQHRAFDEVIVVDDGSTDGSLPYLLKRYADAAGVRVVEQANGGQLSAFKAGLRHASGEILFFLDADDRYHPAYTERALEAYRTQAVDFLSAAPRWIDGSGQVLPKRRRPPPPLRDAGYSVVRTIIAEHFVGGPTSSLSMRRELAEAALAYPHNDDWRLCGDEVLVLGASLLGARKFLLGDPPFDYRIHGANGFAARQRDPHRHYRYAVARSRLVKWFAERMGHDTARLERIVHHEFATIERPTWRELLKYSRLLSITQTPLTLRADQLFKMFRHFGREQWRSLRPGKEPRASDIGGSVTESPESIVLGFSQTERNASSFDSDDSKRAA